MNNNDFIMYLDEEEYNYYYHVTGCGIGQSITQNGLLINGNDVLNINNIIETTTLKLSHDDIKNINDFLNEELGINSIRDTSEMIIIGCPKSEIEIVSPFEDYYDENYYEGIIYPEYIMGYFSKEGNEFILNSEYQYGTDYFYESIESKKTY